MPPAKNLDSLVATLPADVQAQLQLLNRVAHTLNLDDLSFASYAAAVARLSADRLAAARDLIDLRRVEDELRGHLCALQHEERLAARWSDTFHEQYPEGQSALQAENRRAKAALLRKAKEYQRQLDEIVAAMPEVPTSVTALMEQQARVARKREAVKAKRVQVDAFRGLPPDLDLAVDRLRQARDEQTRLIQIRERLLERMVGGVA